MERSTSDEAAFAVEDPKFAMAQFERGRFKGGYRKREILFLSPSANGRVGFICNRSRLRERASKSK